jgi:hypothetical protein
MTEENTNLGATHLPAPEGASGTPAGVGGHAGFSMEPPAPAHPKPFAEPVAFAIGVAGWLVPGLGHALQKMWGRAVICFLTIGVLVSIGAGMRGNLFTSGGNDAFDSLGYMADLGTGSFYLLAKLLEKEGADVSHADGDYGTRFLATAGVLNLLAALHAYEAARGRKA